MTKHQTPSTTDAEFNYLQPPISGQKLFIHVNPETLPPGQDHENVKQESHLLPVRDLRGFEEHFNLSNAGFEVIKTDDTVAKFGDGSESREDWCDPIWVKDVYEREVERLLLEHTGATRVHIFDHTIRRHSHTDAKENVIGSRMPVLRVHIDQTPSSATARVKNHLGEEAENLLSKRFCLINLWRPLRGPVLDTPLAVADYRSIDPEKDLVPVEHRHGGHKPSGETFGVLRNSRHEWYYLSDMHPNEALLLKCYDSDEQPGLARCTPHSAFVDRRYQKKGAPRQSIEVRALVFF